jgi:Immunity protein 53
MTTIARLQRWYLSQCDGDWEHYSQVKIDTLDNPGWRVAINLMDTALEGMPFAEVSDLEPEADWIRCWIEGGQFQGAGGAGMLETILGHFLDWAESISSDG